MKSFEVKTIAFLIVAGIVTLFSLFAIFGSFYTVDDGERTVVLRNGAVKEVTDAGLHFKWPLIESTVDFSVRVEKAQYDSMMAYSKDIQAATLRVTVNHKVEEASVKDIYINYGKGYTDRIIQPLVFAAVKEIFGRYTAVELVGKREEVSSAITVLLQERLRGTGLSVSSFQLENVDFSDAYEKAIEDAMRADAERKQAEFQALRDQAVAKGKADAERERANGIRAVAEAEAYAVQIKGKAMRENPFMVELIHAEAALKAVEKWSGNLPQTMVPGSTVPFIAVGK